LQGKIHCRENTPAQSPHDTHPAFSQWGLPHAHGGGGGSGAAAGFDDEDDDDEDEDDVCFVTVCSCVA
jgi:hypothetical protein